MRAWTVSPVAQGKEERQTESAAGLKGFVGVHDFLVPTVVLIVPVEIDAGVEPEGEPLKDRVADEQGRGESSAHRAGVVWCRVRSHTEHLCEVDYHTDIESQV